MSTTYMIAEVARRSGFNASTLRYYEEVGLIPPPARTPAGYRLYEDSTLSRLAFITRAKQLGCSLEEIMDLAVAWEGELCEPVQAQLRELVATKITKARNQAAEMLAFTAQLEQAADALGRHTPEGPCDDDCGCSTVVDDSAAAATPVALIAKPTRTDEPPIACTLGATDMPGRLEAWQRALDPVVARQPLEMGVRLVFRNGTSLAALADLIAAEQQCCAFFRFALTVDSRGTALEVTAPAAATDLVHSLFGAPE